MGQIQNTINQALALGALGSGKFAENKQKAWESNKSYQQDELNESEKNIKVLVDNSRVMTKGSKELYKNMLNSVNEDRLELATEADNYINKKGWKNPNKYEFYKNMYKSVSEDVRNSVSQNLNEKIDKIHEPGIDFEKPIKSQQLAANAMNKVNEKADFNTYRKENSKGRTEAIKNKKENK